MDKVDGLRVCTPTSEKTKDGTAEASEAVDMVLIRFLPFLYEALSLDAGAGLDERMRGW